jgi:hypothetical protein
MDLSPLIVIVLFVALTAFSIWSRLQDGNSGGRGSELKPPGDGRHRPHRRRHHLPLAGRRLGHAFLGPLQRGNKSCATPSWSSAFPTLWSTRSSIVFGRA